MATEDRGRNDAGIPPKYQLDTKPRRKGEPAKPGDQITPDQTAHFPQESYQTRVFHDHRGEPCLSIWRDFVKDSKESLISPWSYQFYVVTGMAQSSPEASALASKLCKTLIRDLSHNEAVYMRFDFIFLPASASNIDCMSHYWAEKASPSRQQGDFAITPSYKMVGRAQGHSRENALIVVDHNDVRSGGLVWLEFAERESYPAAGPPESLNGRVPRSTLTDRLAADWIGSPMEEIWQLSAVRGELEREFRLAIEMRQL